MKKEMVHAVLLDLDGVVVDSEQANIRDYTHLFLRFGLEPPQANAIRELAGIPSEETIRRLLPSYEKTNNALIFEMAQALPAISEQSLREMRVFPEARAFLEETPTLPKGLVTNRDRETTNAILRNHRLFPYFRVVVTKNDVVYPKPAPDMLFTALRALNVHPSHAVFVGDTVSDALAGKAAGIRTIIFGRTFHPGTEHASSWAEVRRLIQR